MNVVFVDRLARGLRAPHVIFDNAGLVVDHALVRTGCHSTEQAGAALESLLGLPDPPDGVFATNNRIATGVLQVLLSEQRKVGLVGFDNFELADLLGVSVVIGNPAELGCQAVEVLEHANAGETSGNESMVLPTSFIDRGSAASGPVLRTCDTWRPHAS